MYRAGMALAAAAFSILSAGGASAERPLAVGEAAGFKVPEGAVVRAVYTPYRGGRWSPVDTTFGPFREPFYTAPKGYRYIYVRGYWTGPLTHRVSHHASVRRHRSYASCVTDLGYGRYESCP